MRFAKTLFTAAIALGAIACAASDTVDSSTRNAIGKISEAATPPSPASLVVLASKTSPDGYITATMSSSTRQDTAGVNSTYTWSAHNNSSTLTISGVTLGSNWGDYCGSSCHPRTPRSSRSAPGCAGELTKFLRRQIWRVVHADQA